MKSTRSAIVRVMCAVARAELRECDRETIAGVLGSDGLNVSALLQALRAHGLVPLAHRHLSPRAVGLLPPVAALWLRTAFSASATKQARSVLRLFEWLNAFEATSLDVLPYKGPVLSLQLYGDAAMRQHGDLDLLVGPGQAPEVIRLLINNGCLPGDGVEPDGRVPLIRQRHACGLIDPITGDTIEVHWRLVDRMYGVELPLEWLMETPRSIAIGRQQVPAMGGERLLLSLCLHGGAHQWERLIWLADVAQLIRSEPRMDWSHIEARAARLRFTRSLAATLILVRDLFGDVPDWNGAHRLMEEPGARVFARRVMDRLDSGAELPLSMRERFHLGWLGRQSLIDRAIFGWRVLTDLSSRDLGDSNRTQTSAVSRTRRVVRLIREAARSQGRT